MGVSAGTNIGRRLMAQGVAPLRRVARGGIDWLSQVEIDPHCALNDLPRTFSGGGSAYQSPAT
jgi:ABC-type phosphonate transport system ATPase subunit